jgi:uncharacterized protein with PIN domain
VGAEARRGLLHLIEDNGTLTAQLDSERELQARNGLLWKGDAPYCPGCWGKKKESIVMSRYEPEPGSVAYRCHECQRLYWADKDGNFHRRDAHVD